MTDEESPHLKSLALLEGLIEEAELDWAVTLDPEPLARSTGLPESVVVAGLHRRPLPESDFLQQVTQRLEFLRRTRLGPAGRPYTQAEIAHGAGLTPQWFGRFLRGEKAPSLEHAARIEDFFQVPRGFLTATPSQALDRALREKLEEEQSRQLAELQDFKRKNQLNGFALRGTSPKTRAVMQALIDSIEEDQLDA
ncbi:helix-turn-helix domain-containing protein [Streptomyces sp. NPDC051555]|uniref:helix-turn-helix domain-containing protein n=1 Tax=Streptomyces sp. NPDC051555 TaxID=3365657 RepID=UPI0037902830